MTEKTIGQTVADWNKGDRPLKKLTKADLFLFPMITTVTREREWAFSKEVLARRVAFGALAGRAESAKKEVDTAKRYLDGCELNLVKARDRLKVATETKNGPEIESANRLIEILKRAQTQGHERLATAIEGAAILQAQVADAGKVDAVISEEELNVFYAQRYGPEWIEYPRRFKEINLFQAQSWGFASFITATKEDRDKDMAEYKKAESFANLCGQIKSADFIAITALWQIRIAPTLAERARFLDEDRECRPAGMKDDLKKQYWIWWRAYNRATRVFKWVDASNVAYDERNFNADEDRHAS